MMSPAEYEFAKSIRETIKMHPEWSGSAAMAMSNGALDAAASANKDARDWEVVAMGSISQRLSTKGSNANVPWIISKVEALSARAGFRWDAILEKLRAQP